MKALSIVVLLTLLIASTILSAAETTPTSGVAMHGTTKYGQGFKYFDYVNPKAPKGGTLKQYSIGGFDSLHPFVAKGSPAIGIGLIYDTLTTKSDDEPFSQYGLLAETFEIPEDRSWVTFHLQQTARFSDGKPVTAEDVQFSFEVLIEKGTPLYRQYYADVDKVTVLDVDSVRFDFKPGVNRELALIIGQLPVFPKHDWKDRDFSKPTLDIPIGSGPYIIDSFDVNKRISYKRNPHYWGKNIPVNVGRYNFDTITYDYYLDQTVALEAFKSGNYDFRNEHTSKVWATEYDFPAVKEGRVKVEEIDHLRPTGMQAFVFNTRRPQFKDPLVREALSYAFDFEWSNNNLFFGAYTRTNSFFSNSRLASTGVPSKGELRYLEPLKNSIPEQVFTTTYKSPTTDGSGNVRNNLKKAIQLLRQAGWQFRNGTLVNSEGEPLRFEILIVQPAFERIINPFRQNLKKIGVDAEVRVVDTSQYINRIRSFDFDVIISTFGQTSSPGNEQRDFWHSTVAGIDGSRNLIGIQNPAIDALVEQVIQAPDQQSLTDATRALDRVLLWNYYVIPQWHVNYDRIAYWNYLKRPEITPSHGVNILHFWYQK